MSEFNDEVYMHQRAHFMAIFRSMRPDENASEEMRDAFSDALEDFYYEEL